MSEQRELPEIDIVSPDEAEDILRPEVQQLMDEGWRLVSKPLYGARLELDRNVMDLRVDLLGNIEREMRVRLVSGADTGRLVAWVLLITALLVTLVVASQLGFLD